MDGAPPQTDDENREEEQEKECLCWKCWNRSAVVVSTSDSLCAHQEAQLAREWSVQVEEALLIATWLHPLLAMASPPHKMSKLAHDAARDAQTTVQQSKQAAESSSSLPPPPSTSKRLGLTSGVDKAKVKKITLKPKRECSARSCNAPGTD